MIFALLGIVCSLPGKPNIAWGNRKFAFVVVDMATTAYQNMITQRYTSVPVNLAWDVWSGSPGTSFNILFNGTKVFSGPVTGPSTNVTFNMSKGGKFTAIVQVCDNSGCSESDQVPILIADTDGSHLDPLHVTLADHNKAFSRSKNKTVSAYFVEWGVYARNYSVKDIPAPNLDQIYYAFGMMCGGDGINDGLKTIPGSFQALQRACVGRSDFKLTIFDPWAALQMPQGSLTAWDQPYKGNFGNLMALKRGYPQLKIILSIGGWSGSDPFYFFGNKTIRDLFVASVKQFILTWKFFDGIDIDWEYPGGGGVNPKLGSPDDGKTYVALMNELRFMLSQVTDQTGRKLSLSTAVSADVEKMNRVRFVELQSVLNALNIMTYDFNGAWDLQQLGLMTNLYAPSWDNNTRFTADKAVRNLLSMGVPAAKIGVGVAMYGRGWTGVANYTGSPFTGHATGPCKGTYDQGVEDYKSIMKECTGAGWSVGYDQKGQSPFTFKEGTGDLIAFENERSAKVKGMYVRSLGLRGLFAWQLDGDNGDVLNGMVEGTEGMGEVFAQ